MHACVYAHREYVQPHVQPLFQTATAEEQLHQRQLSLISLYLRHLFLAYSFSPLSLHTFFFPLLFFAHSLVLLLLCFPPILFLTFASLCSTYLPGRFSAKEKRCFLFYIHLPFLESSLFLKCRLKGSISQVILCPTTCKTRSHPHLHPQPIHQTAAASLADSCLISHKLVLPLTHFPFVSCSYSFHSPHALSRLPSLSGPHISFFFLQMPHSSPLRNVISVFSFCSVISPCPSFSLGNSSIVCCSSVPSSLISLSPSPSQCMSLRLCL